MVNVTKTEIEKKLQEETKARLLLADEVKTYKEKLEGKDAEEKRWKEKIRDELRKEMLKELLKLKRKTNLPST